MKIQKLLKLFKQAGKSVVYSEIKTVTADSVSTVYACDQIRDENDSIETKSVNEMERVLINTLAEIRSKNEY